MKTDGNFSPLESDKNEEGTKGEKVLLENGPVIPSASICRSVEADIMSRSTELNCKDDLRKAFCDSFL